MFSKIVLVLLISAVVQINCRPQYYFDNSMRKPAFGLPSIQLNPLIASGEKASNMKVKHIKDPEEAKDIDYDQNTGNDVVNARTDNKKTKIKVTHGHEVESDNGNDQKIQSSDRLESNNENSNKAEVGNVAKKVIDNVDLDEAKKEIKNALGAAIDDAVDAAVDNGKIKTNVDVDEHSHSIAGDSGNNTDIGDATEINIGDATEIDIGDEKVSNIRGNRPNCKVKNAADKVVEDVGLEEAQNKMENSLENVVGKTEDKLDDEENSSNPGIIEAAKEKLGDVKDEISSWDMKEVVANVMENLNLVDAKNKIENALETVIDGARKKINIGQYEIFLISPDKSWKKSRNRLDFWSGYQYNLIKKVLGLSLIKSLNVDEKSQLVNYGT